MLGLQTTFAENWLEAAEEVLTSSAYFPACAEMASDDGVASEGEAAGLVVGD